MRNNFRSNFDGAVTYITGRFNEINALKPSAGTRYISASTRKTSWNGVDISNPERSFKPDEWDRLKQDGQTMVNKYRNEIRNPPRQEGGRGHGGHGRGGRGGRGGRYGYGGRGGHKGRGRGRGRGGGRGQENERVVQEVNANNDDKKPPETSSGGNTGTATSPKGGQAGVQFK